MNFVITILVAGIIVSASIVGGKLVIVIVTAVFGGIMALLTKDIWIGIGGILGGILGMLI